LSTLNESGIDNIVFSASEERGKHSSSSHEFKGTSRQPERAEESKMRLTNATLIVFWDS
jgi:hypothetical protein